MPCFDLTTRRLSFDGLLIVLQSFYPCSQALVPLTRDVRFGGLFVG